MIIVSRATHGDFSDSILLKWPLREWNAVGSYKNLSRINDHILTFFDTYLK